MAFHDMPDRGRLLLPGAHDITDRMLAKSKAVVPTVRAELDVAYGPDFYQKIDLYLPKDRALTDLPVLMFFHGGAWRHGFKEWEGFIAPAIIDLPAIYISGNYRLAPESKWPVQLNDVSDALAWVYHNIARFGGNPDRIVWGGHSAGGHLTTMVTLRRNVRDARGLPDDVIKACCPVSGMLDVRIDRFPPGGTREKVALNVLARREDAPDADPLAFTAGNRTPFYVSWGEHDTDDIKSDAAAFLDQMRRERGPVESEIFPGLSHFETNEACGDPNFAWTRKVRAWLRNPPPRG